MKRNKQHTISLTVQLAVMVAVIATIWMSIRALEDRFLSAREDAIALRAVSNTTYSAPASNLPRYTPTFTHTTYDFGAKNHHAEVNTVRHSTLSGMRSSATASGYRVHERRFSNNAYQGGNGGGIALTSSNGSSVSSVSVGRGVSIPSVSLSMPVLAVNSPNISSTSGIARAIRHAAPTREGDFENETTNEGDDGWWIWDDEANNWRRPTNEDTRIIDGTTYYWNNGDWSLVPNQQDPVIDAPIGNLPILFLLLLAGGYMVYTRRRKRLA